MISLSPKDEYSELCEIYAQGLRKTLEELMSFIKEIENDVIINEEEIIIYDGYLE